MANVQGRGTGSRGFASMDPQRQRQIASQGGRAAHVQGTAHEFSSEEARAAGRKGGEAVSRNREHMAEIGRRGGESRGNSAQSRGGNGVGRAVLGRDSPDAGTATPGIAISELDDPSARNN